MWLGTTDETKRQIYFGIFFLIAEIVNIGYNVVVKKAYTIYFQNILNGEISVTLA